MNEADLKYLRDVFGRVLDGTASRFEAAAVARAAIDQVEDVSELHRLRVYLDATAASVSLRNRETEHDS